jgi:hypothetical protein
VNKDASAYIYINLSHRGFANDPPLEPTVDIDDSRLRVLLRRRDAEGDLGMTLSISGPVKSGWEQVAMHQSIATMVAVTLEDAGHPPPASLAGPSREAERVRSELAERLARERDRLRDERDRLRDELGAVTDERDQLLDLWYPDYPDRGEMAAKGA